MSTQPIPPRSRSRRNIPEPSPPRTSPSPTRSRRPPPDRRTSPSDARPRPPDRALTRCRCPRSDRAGGSRPHTMARWPASCSDRSCATWARPRRRSGWRRTRRARSRCWGTGPHLPRRGPSLRPRPDRGLTPASVTPYEVHAGRRAGLAARRRPPAERDPHPEPRAAGPARVRLVPGRRAGAPALHAVDGRAPGGLRGRRALGLLAPAPGGPGDVARLPAAAGRPGLRRRGLAGDARVHPGPPDVSEPPGEEVADFEEYTRLYRESWSDPDIRWLLSTVPSTMIFDDHDVHDDWNISAVVGRGHAPRCPGGRSGSSGPSWRTGSTSTSGTSRRPSSPRSDCCRAVHDDEDAGPRLRAFARMATASRRQAAGPSTATSGARGSSSIDSRAARVLSRRRAGDGRRRASGTGSSSTPGRRTTTSSSRARSRSS